MLSSCDERSDDCSGCHSGPPSCSSEMDSNNTGTQSEYLPSKVLLRQCQRALAFKVSTVT